MDHSRNLNTPNVYQRTRVGEPLYLLSIIIFHHSTTVIQIKRYFCTKIVSISHQYIKLLRCTTMTKPYNVRTEAKKKNRSNNNYILPIVEVSLVIRTYVFFFCFLTQNDDYEESHFRSM